MDNWANFLKKQAEDMQIPIINTTHMGIDEMSDWFKQYLKTQVKVEFQ